MYSAYEINERRAFTIFKCTYTNPDFFILDDGFVVDVEDTAAGLKVIVFALGGIVVVPLVVRWHSHPPELRTQPSQWFAAIKLPPSFKILLWNDHDRGK